MMAWEKIYRRGQPAAGVLPPRAGEWTGEAFRSGRAGDGPHPAGHPSACHHLPGSAFVQTALCVFASLALTWASASTALSEEAPAQPAGDEEKTFTAVPIIGYTRETSALAGVMVVKAHRWQDADSRTRPNTIAFSGFYTLKNQWGVGMAPAVYLDGEKYQLKLTAYAHETPAKFWGVGNEAGESGKKEDFSASGAGLLFTATRLVYRSLRVGPGFWVATASIYDKEPGGLLDTDALTGSDGGNDIGLRLVAEWDGRDNIYTTSSGTYALFTAAWHDNALGSDYDYGDFSLDLKRFFPLADGHVLGVQAKAKVMTGDPPYYRLAWLGGIGMLRGIYEGRFRDKNMAAAQAEYRFPLWDRLGGAVFAGLGEVASTPAAFNTADIRFAAGVGLRYILDPKERINLRLDVGFSEFGVAPILVITEAF